MLVERCNRCRRDIPHNHYKFKIEEKLMSGSRWDELCTPETRLDDFHLCLDCMREFIEFIKEGKK